jgi:hypothetical protein
MPAARMVDLVRAPDQSEELRLKVCVIKQDSATAVKQWLDLLLQLAFGEL